MLSRVCKFCNARPDIAMVNLRRKVYKPSPGLLDDPIVEDQPEKRSNKDGRVPIIIAKRPEFNFYKGKTFSKFETIPLCSGGWRHSKSAGDHFTIYPHFQEAELEDSEEIGEIATDFQNFGLHPQLVENLETQGITEPTEIQNIAIPKLLAGENSILSAETGCGKTIAFLLPLLHHITVWRNLPETKDRPMNSPFGLIITPSRELAEQIGKEAKKLAATMNIRVKILTGGRTKRLSANPDIRDIDLLVGSFGVVSKMTSTRIYKLDYVRHVILDEAHALFHETFDDKLEVFLKRINFNRSLVYDNLGFPNASQLTLVSATKPSEMPEYLSSILDIKGMTEMKTNRFHRIMVPQKFMRLSGLDKPMTLLRLVKPRAMQKHQFIVFTNDSPTCDWISMFLNEFGLRTVYLNGEMPMKVRTGQFNKFLRGEYTILSTTNAGSRGLDTVNVNDVINYDFPMETADYVHRCGRTGRIGTQGECKVTNFICRNLEVELTQKIERSARRLRPIPIFNMLEEAEKRWQQSTNSTEKKANETKKKPNDRRSKAHLLKLKARQRRKQVDFEEAITGGV